LRLLEREGKVLGERRKDGSGPRTGGDKRRAEDTVKPRKEIRARDEQGGKLELD
jgi:predicted Rdx family selenoprotein